MLKIKLILSYCVIIIVKTKKDFLRFSFIKKTKKHKTDLPNDEPIARIKKQLHGVNEKQKPMCVG